MDDAEALVFDLGSGVCKFGFAGDDEPLVEFSPVVGRSRYPRVMNIRNRKSIYIGNDAQRKGILNVKSAIERGVVTDWDDMENILGYAFSELHVPSTERPILLSEPLRNPKKQREKFAEVLFEAFDAPSISFEDQPVLSMFSSGRHAGIILECGHGVTQIAAIQGLYVIPNSIVRSNMAGSDVTDYLAEILRERGVHFSSSTEMEIARDIKEKHSCVALDPEAETAANDQTYLLPDGRSICFGNERFRCSEILFQPSLVGKETPGVHQMLFDSINKCDVDLRKDFFANLIISGGGALTPQFSQRIEKEVGAMASAKVRVKTVPLGKNSVWIGGSIVASLSTYRQMWISKKVYQELGAGVFRDYL